jgi:phage anti-repressor protein
MVASLNIVNLIENNPITKLSRDYNNKFINKIKINFTETQQQLFISSLYCYLNYNQTTDFVIDLDNIWGWLGFQQKVNAKTLLEKQFIKDKDYILLLSQQKQTNDIRGGHNKQTFLLNIQTFKLFCIKAGTKKANEIHEYFIKLEELLHQVVQEETDELKKQLENNKKQIENQMLVLETEKDKLREKTLLEQFTENIQCVYYGLIDNRSENNEKLIKFGNSNDLYKRVRCHKKTYKNFRLVNAFKVDNKFYIENAIKNNEIFKTYRRTIEINNINCTELLAIDDLSLENVDRIIKEIIKKIEYNPENYIKLLEENLRLKDDTTQLKDENNILKQENIQFKNKNKIITREMSTQTCEEDFIENKIEIHAKDELTLKFDKFIEEHCIVRPDVEVSSTDIIGQYRIITQSASKEIFQSMMNYLNTRFKPSRLKYQNKNQVVNGFTGVRLKEIKYEKSQIPSDEQNFIFHSCIFSPSGKVLFSDLLEEYKKWKQQVNKEVLPNDNKMLRTYIDNTKYTLYTTIWTVNGNGQGYYGLTLKRDIDKHKLTSSTGKRVGKRNKETNELLGTWETIAKAAESEKICAPKMSRSIKNKVIFNDDYYYCIL